MAAREAVSVLASELNTILDGKLIKHMNDIIDNKFASLLVKLDDVISQRLEVVYQDFGRRVGRMESILVCSSAMSPSVDEVLNELLSKKDHKHSPIVQNCLNFDISSDAGASTDGTSSTSVEPRVSEREMEQTSSTPSGTMSTSRSQPEAESSSANEELDMQSEHVEKGSSGLQAMRIIESWRELPTDHWAKIHAHFPGYGGLESVSVLQEDDKDDEDDTGDQKLADDQVNLHKKEGMNYKGDQTLADDVENLHTKGDRDDTGDDGDQNLAEDVDNLHKKSDKGDASDTRDQKLTHDQLYWHLEGDRVGKGDQKHADDKCDNDGKLVSLEDFKALLERSTDDLIESIKRDFSSRWSEDGSSHGAPPSALDSLVPGR
jgi:hypothetical protein